MKIKYMWDNHIGPILILHFFDKDYGLCLCHKMEERSVKFLGLEKYFCSRCLGILIGGFTGILLKLLGYYIPYIFILLFAIPLLIDGISQFIGLRMSNNYLRIVTGFLFGISIYFLGGVIWPAGIL